MPPRQRLHGKQAPPPGGEPAVPVAAAGLAALADEAWCELTALDDGARRRHVHWTHIRTNDPAHRQPDSFSREQVWEHICRVYADVYPEAANPSGSIVMFGAVAKERHAESREEPLRAIHHHVPTYCSRQHYWRPVAARSLAQYSVKLHAACHDGYTSMYAYICEPSPRKPLSELDAEVFLSSAHPRGAILQRLLESGARSGRALSARRPGNPQPEAQAKRMRTSDLYELARTSGIRTASSLQVRAQEEAQQGQNALALFCTSQGSMKLQEHLDAAWAVLSAPARASVSDITLVGKFRVAVDIPCVCAGIYNPGLVSILTRNRISVLSYAHAICQALALGARRGVHVGIIGGPGCGKSTLLQALERIFDSFPPPEEGSSFALNGIIDTEIILWQDFEYSPKTVSWQDLLRLLVGERVSIRVPHAANVPHNNRAPMFFSGFDKIRYPFGIGHKRDMMNQSMDERFNFITLTYPIPEHLRRVDFPTCASCFAKLILENEAAWARMTHAAAQAAAAQAAAAGPAAPAAAAEAGPAWPVP